MKLEEVQIKNFRNILDSGNVDIQHDVTCLVGKNESGKTAFLQALHRLNPVHKNVSFSIPDHYPAWLEKRHRRTMNLEEFCPAIATFAFEDKDRNLFEERFGAGVLKSETVVLSRQYDGKLLYDYEVDEAAAVKALLTDVSLPSGAGAKLTTLAGVDEFIASPEALIETKGAAEAISLPEARIKVFGDGGGFDDSVISFLDTLIPKFFYYADYSTLPGSVEICELLQADKSTLDDDRLTARALLELAGAESDYLLNADYERRKRELENVANVLTQEILDYWTTNTEIRVDIDITQKTENAQNGQQTVLDEMKVRLWDNRHFLSLPFDERSTGFRWFFSFLAAFSAYEHDDQPVIILLDEPGLGLHARAQKDFLRFIDERLSANRQVLFTTHSPFMVQPNNLDRVRMVEDHGRDMGSTVSSDVLGTDPDTLFPLQGALGYDLAQHLFVAPHNLVVEGTSDFTYLTVMSRHLIDEGREGLNEKWSLIPVGGADMVPTFVALLGNHLDVTVLVDSQKAGHQRLERMADQGLLKRNRIIMIGTTVKQKFADIEYVFSIDDYIVLYNEAFGQKLKPGDLTGTDPIVARIERHTRAEYDHGKPADVLLRKRDEFLPKIEAETLNRFEKLFQAINATL